MRVSTATRWCLAALLALIACAIRVPPVLAQSAPNASSVVVHVPADADWTPSGLDVAPGSTYAIVAEGHWRMALGCPSTDAAGSGLKKSIFCFSTGGEPLRGVNFQTLIGRIGPNGPPFVVGTRLSLAPDRAGQLYLRSNSDVLFDNVGSMTVTIGPQAPPPRPVVSSPPPPMMERFATAPLDVSFPRGAERPDDIAVVIGNADYGRQGKDIPNVLPAYADAEGARRYAVEALGIREGNVIFLKDATGAQLTRVFGSKDDHRGQLFDWVRPGRSRVFIYYAGHGAPAVREGSPYLVPADADSARIELNGYPLKTLYDNLAKLPADGVTVVLEACFSGVSQAGSVLASASPVFAKVEAPKAPAKVTVIAAGAADQIASWEQDKSHSLFTKYFLLGQSGAADKAPYGDGNGTVALDELDRYLKDTLTYYARRYYGRDQTAQIVNGGGGP